MFSFPDSESVQLREMQDVHTRLRYTLTTLVSISEKLIGHVEGEYLEGQRQVPVELKEAINEIMEAIRVLNSN